MTSLDIVFDKRIFCAFAGPVPSRPMFGVRLTIVPQKLGDVLYINPTGAGGVHASTHFQMNLESARELAEGILTAIAGAKG